MLWSEIKGDARKVAEYIASAPKRKAEKKQSILKYSAKKSIASDTNVSPSDESAVEDDYSSNVDTFSPQQQVTYPNSCDIVNNGNAFSESLDEKRLLDFVSYVMKNAEDQSLAKKFLTDKCIWKEDVFSSICKAVSKEWGVFNDLRCKYEERSKRGRQSKFEFNDSIFRFNGPIIVI